MPTLQEVKRQIVASGGDLRFAKREIRALPDVLLDDEQILCAVNGIVSSASMGAGIGMLVASSTRVFFLNAKMFGRSDLTEFSYAQISAINYSRKLTTSAIRIETASAVVKVGSVTKAMAPKFCDTVREKIGVDRLPSAEIPDQQDEQPAMFEQLEKLADLRDRGILSDTEFEEQKARLLS